ncbi:FAD-dependent monooxygenase [Streptomyces sp. XY006]|uniref:FAD-dependent monooxygenase n=1 Tax=Streptomyces sp. XY006 TaxID=2021410 RepID=UPI000B8BBD93|nr:FAD-dependent monooxygenase [Streptomyces sp. XY006]OXS37006.1 hypothetical protein CHR28_00410 [Streptomyces sp. XY006]
MTAPLDVLVVGAGPTGLALATQLRAYDTPFRIVDRSLDRARESRAPAILGYVAGGTDLTGLRAYLARWLPSA